MMMTSVFFVVQNQDHLTYGNQKKNGMYRVGFANLVLIKKKG